MSRLLDEFNIDMDNTKYQVDDYDVFKDKELLDQFRIKILHDISDNDFRGDNVSKELILREIDEVIYGYDLSSDEKNYLFQLIDSEVNGYGPITELLRDDNVTEIMVNDVSSIYVEIDGKIEKDNSVSFINENHIMRTIERLLLDSGKCVDVRHSYVDAMLSDGSRINVVIPPLSLKPTMTIRKYRKNIETMDDLVGNGSLTPYMARYLEAAVKGRLNIIVTGSAAAGKTTLLNILGNFIPSTERVITIEDVRELNLKKQHVVSLETRGALDEGVGEVTVNDLVLNSLRMRPDRIIIGEVRGKEAYSLLQAMNTGHDGSLTTLHANSSKDGLHRLETMILMDGLEIPINVVREYICEAIDLVVHIERMSDGKRKVTSIGEVLGVKDGEIEIKEIFNFKSKKNKDGNILGEFSLLPGNFKTVRKIQRAGIDSIDDIFNNRK